MCGSGRAVGSGGRAGAGRNAGHAPGPEACFWAEGSLLHDGAQAGEGRPWGDPVSTGQASKMRPVPGGDPPGPCLCPVPPGTGGGRPLGAVEKDTVCPPDPLAEAWRRLLSPQCSPHSLCALSWFCRGGFP